MESVTQAKPQKVNITSTEDPKTAKMALEKETLILCIASKVGFRTCILSLVKLNNKPLILKNHVNLKRKKEKS